MWLNHLHVSLEPHNIFAEHDALYMSGEGTHYRLFILQITNWVNYWPDSLLFPAHVFIMRHTSFTSKSYPTPSSCLSAALYQMCILHIFLQPAWRSFSWWTATHVSHTITFCFCPSELCSSHYRCNHFQNKLYDVNREGMNLCVLFSCYGVTRLRPRANLLQIWKV